MLLVVLFKNVFVRKISEQEQRVVQAGLQLFFGAPAAPLFESVVQVQAHVLGRARLQIQKVLERLVQGVLESLVRQKGFFDQTAAHDDSAIALFGRQGSLARALRVDQGLPLTD